MGEAAHGGLHPAEHDGRIGEELPEDARIDRGGVIGTEARLSAGGVGVVAAQALVGRVVVHHRIHVAGGDPEEKSRGAEFFEVAQVVLPVGLRKNRHAGRPIRAPRP